MAEQSVDVPFTLLRACSRYISVQKGVSLRCGKLQLLKRILGFPNKAVWILACLDVDKMLRGYFKGSPSVFMQDAQGIRQRELSIHSRPDCWCHFFFPNSVLSQMRRVYAFRCFEATVSSSRMWDKMLLNGAASMGESVTVCGCGGSMCVRRDGRFRCMNRS